VSVLDIIMSRKSIRRYREDPIPDEVFLRVMEAARLAPSGKNLQPWKFIVIREKEMKRSLAEASRGQLFMAGAPVILAACGCPDMSYPRQGNYMKSWPIDVTIALQHLMLQAEEEGLGTCWIGAFEEKDVKRLLHVPEDWRVLALTPLGFPAQVPDDRGRKPLSEIVSYEKF
jgi:nitroreductase